MTAWSAGAGTGKTDREQHQALDLQKAVLIGSLFASDFKIITEKDQRTGGALHFPEYAFQVFRFIYIILMRDRNIFAVSMCIGEIPVLRNSSLSMIHDDRQIIGICDLVDIIIGS